MHSALSLFERLCDPQPPFPSCFSPPVCERSIAQPRNLTLNLPFSFPSLPDASSSPRTPSHARLFLSPTTHLRTNLPLQPGEIRLFFSFLFRDSLLHPVLLLSSSTRLASRFCASLCTLRHARPARKRSEGYSFPDHRPDPRDDLFDDNNADTTATEDKLSTSFPAAGLVSFEHISEVHIRLCTGVTTPHDVFTPSKVLRNLPSPRPRQLSRSDIFAFLSGYQLVALIPRLQNISVCNYLQLQTSVARTTVWILKIISNTREPGFQIANKAPSTLALSTVFSPTTQPSKELEQVIVGSLGAETLTRFVASGKQPSLNVGSHRFTALLSLETPSTFKLFHHPTLKPGSRSVLDARSAIYKAQLYRVRQPSKEFFRLWSFMSP